MSHEAAAPDRYRWTIGLLLGVGVLVNYYDRVNLTVSHDALVSAFGIRESTFGFLLSAYSWTYAACQLPMGVVLDKVGVKRVMLWGVALWGVASVASAVAPGVFLFLLARLLLGVGEAPTFPANAKAVGKWFPQAERSLATAFFDSASKLANATGVPLLGLLLLRIGWRASFGVTAVLSFGFLLLFWWLYREPERFSMRNVVVAGAKAPSLAGEDFRRLRAPAPSEEATDGAAIVAPPIPLGRLLRQRKVIGLTLGYAGYNYVFYLLMTWMPKYLSSQLHVTAAKSFVFTGLPWIVAVAAEFLIGGLLVDWLIKSGRDAGRVRQVVLVCGTLCGLGLFGAAFATTAPQALLAISVAIGGLSAAAPVGWAGPSILVPDSSTGRVGGILNFSNQICAILAPIVTGFVYERTHSFTWAFGIASAFLCVGVLAYLFLLGRMEAIDVEAALRA
ncbi:MFS transporter [Terriglobus aquaticus]|uniref:MFS transporter n=1 Tax=Terriglobus aquaticus TaxID=940139 RepID=A0ABW9KI81_9BACT|nr:MFS transporter [Terriglobus aquaticus]